MTAGRHTATYTTERAYLAGGLEYQTAEAENGTWARVTRNGEIVAGPDRNTSAMMRAYQQEMRNVGWTHPEDNGCRFCLDCGATFATTALLDAHQDETGHEKDQSTEVTITRA